MRKHPNNFKTTLNGSISDSDMSLTLTDSLPSLTGSDYYILTLNNGSVFELIRINSTSGAPTYTIASRGLEGTSAENWSDGSFVSVRVTQGSIEGKQDLLDTATLSTVTLTSSDSLLIKDDSDSGKLKQSLASDLISLNPIVKIGSQTASSSSSLNFTSLGDYSEIMFIFNDLTVSIDNTGSAVYTGIFMRTSTDNGSTYDSGASDYGYAGRYENSNSATTNWQSDSNTQINIIHNSSTAAPGNAATGSGIHGEVKLYNPAGTSVYKFVKAEMVYRLNGASGYFSQCRTVGCRKSTSDIDAVTFFPSQGNFVSGTITAYGIKK